MSSNWRRNGGFDMKKMIRNSVLVGAVFAPGAVFAEDRPLALVEHIAAAPEAGVSEFDYVYDKDKIDLRPNGEIRLAYFDKCQVETITGGIVKLNDDRAKVSKGGVSTVTARPCQTAALSLDEDAREAGVSVKRVSPFPKEEWREVSVAVSTPLFIWPLPKSGDKATVTVRYLDVQPPEVIWQGNVSDHHLAYPADAPPLKIGMPYEVIISYDGKSYLSGVFSIDPGLELPESPLTTAVPLGL